MEQYKKEFIEFMIDCNVLKFGDFVTKSGRKTPFFVNTGFYRTGSQLKRLGEYYAQAIHDHFGFDFDVLFGPAYKGIPLSVAATIAISEKYDKDIRYCSNRKEVKDHGDKGILLGSPIQDGDKVIIIEDVTTAGTSIQETLPIIKAQGDVEVGGLVVSVDRMERGQGEKSALTEISEKYGMKTTAIVTMEEVVEHLYNKPYKGKVIIDDKLKAAIANDSDTVIKFFSQLANNLYSTLNKKLGTSNSMSSYMSIYNDKEMATQYSEYKTKISDQETKISTWEDYYYKKFSRMESALASLNSQASSISGLFG